MGGITEYNILKTIKEYSLFKNKKVLKYVVWNDKYSIIIIYIYRHKCTDTTLMCT